MISCIIIDDERNAREAFEKIIKRYFSDKLEPLAICESLKEGVAAIHKYNPDIVFLDIEMPQENGFELFKYFKNIDFEVVFTTAFNKYAINAIRYAALDYILKPLNFIDLNDALTRYTNRKKNKSRDERIEILLSNLNLGVDIKAKVALPTLSGFHMEKINNIIYCEADHNYTKIHLIYGKTIIVSKTLKLVEELLPQSIFFRIHKSFLVNMNYVVEYIKNDGHKVILDDGKVLTVANRRTEEFSTALTSNSYNQNKLN